MKILSTILLGLLLSGFAFGETKTNTNTKSSEDCSLRSSVELHDKTKATSQVSHQENDRRERRSSKSQRTTR